jgi:signal transduction histidine kinase
MRRVAALRGPGSRTTTGNPRSVPSRAGTQGARGRRRRYREITHLLDDLRGLIRPLAGGLDPRPLASALITTLRSDPAVEGAAVVLGSETGRLVGADGRVPEDGWTAPLQRRLARQAQMSRVPASAPLADRVVLAVPVLGQHHPVATVLLLCPASSASRVLPHAQGAAHDWAVELEAAALFAEVQDLAARAERSRIAREMHDGVAQDLASLGYLVDDLLAGDDEEIRPGLEGLRHEISSVVTALRLSIHDLRSDGLRTGGLAGAIGEIARREAQCGDMAVHLRLQETHNTLTADVEHELLRVAQEAITNAQQHSGGANLWVSCVVGPGGVVIAVEDDGVGLHGESAESLGLSIMVERAARVGAVLSIQTRPPHGTAVRVELETGAGAASIAS